VTRVFQTGLVIVAAFVMAPLQAVAQNQAALSGTIVDTLGARLAGASVTLLREGQKVQEGRSDGEGAFSFTGLASDRYQVEASMPGFQSKTSEAVFLGQSGRIAIEVALEIGPLRQDVVVTAGATGQLQSRTGAPVTVIDEATIDAINKLDVLEALRLVPAAQIVQVGQRGGQTSLFLRGGESNFTKVLIDGIPVNDIGGGFDFSQLTLASVERVEVLRQTNSVIYGSDALTGVVNISTRRGTSRVPALDYLIDGGSLGTFNNALSFGGAYKRFDYFSQYSYYTTDNDTPNNGFRNGTYAGRFGVAVGNATNLSGTVRYLDGRTGNPNAFDLYRIADDSVSNSNQTYISVAANSQLTSRWQTTVRFGSTNAESLFVNPTPTGVPFAPFGFTSYMGEVVTLEGADGRTVTGQGILDFGGTYPSEAASRTTRQSLFGQATFQATSNLAISAGGRYEHEAGYDDLDGDPSDTRNNGGGFVEGRATLRNRVYISAGLGVEHNEVFETAYTPRLSVAAYLRNPSNEQIGETKLTLNAGKGIKAPSVFQGQNSLFELVNGTPAGSGVEPLGPEKSRSFDIGLEQAFAAGHLRARVGYFNNTFENLLEFLSNTQLVAAGVPPSVAAETEFGAYINSASFDAQGIELSADAALGMGFRLSASYTYMDAEVTEAFGRSAAFNPAFPTIPIGTFSPLVGERPFRRPANSGTLFLGYTRGPFDVALSGYFAGRRDDSTFMTDGFFGNSMLLPNQDLDPAYQKIDVSASYRLHPRLRVYTTIDNIFNEDYAAAFGYPSLPATIRVGASVGLGGD